MDDRLGQRGRGDGLVSQTHGDGVSAGPRFRLDPLLGAAGKNQHTSLGARVLDRRAHESVDEFLQDDLAGDRLRHFDHGREIQVLDRCRDRARRTRDPLILPQVRMQLIELAHLPVGSPAQIAVPGVSQICLRDLVETTCGIETRGELVSKTLVLDEAVLACRANRILVQAHRVQLPAFQPRNLGAGQRRARRERCG